ncbi:MAG: HAMP domain-containing protein [Treponema sp.]|nr:HAMP domain-containing protein [Treponema sp.]
MIKKKRKSLSIIALLILLNSIILATGFIILLNQNINTLKKTAQVQAEKNLRTFSGVLIPLLNSNINNLDYFAKSIASHTTDFRVTLVDNFGKVLADSDVTSIEELENHINRKEIKGALAGKKTTTIRKSTVSKNDVMYYAVPVKIEDKTMAFRVSMPVGTSVYFTTDVRLRMIISICIIFFIILIFSLFISFYIIKRIKKLTKAALEYKKGNFNYKSNISSPKELAQLCRSMENMAAELGRLEQVRKDFVSNVSHELKTPITSITGFTETLLDGAIEDKDNAIHFLEIIKSQSKRLSAIIEDLLSLSRLEKDSQKPQMIKENIVDLSTQIFNSFLPNATEKNIKMEIHSSTDSVFCMLNLGLYEEALGNIIDNAIKYCPQESQIDLKINLINHKERTKVQIIVEDNGNGIPLEHHSRIFERFYRVDKGRSREMGGTGLGLSISSHIVKAHNGNLFTTTRQDKKSGAVFVIELPVVAFN